MNDQTITNCLLGTMAGDALGLPYENLTAGRASRLLGPPNRHRLLFGRGMVSDDTEHACLVAQSLIASAGDDAVFERQLAKRLRRWFLCGPAGIGRATLRSGVKLCLGFGPQRSGVYSGGNGPSMRAAIIGAAVDNLDHVIRLIHLSSRMTHTDPVTQHGATAVALAAWGAARDQFDNSTQYFDLLRHRLAGESDTTALLQAMDQVAESLANQEATVDFSHRFCDGAKVSGHTLQTVPVSIHAWLRYRCDYGQTIRQLILCGGDTDSTAAIAGGITGCETNVIDYLLDRIVDWPLSVGFVRRLGEQLSTVVQRGVPDDPIQTSLVGQLSRNAWFFIIVLIHGLRRLLPPY